MTGNAPRIPKLADVAKSAGVSTATVSRCLNSPDRVIAETREKVLNAVRELGYAPNFNARALAARRSNTFGAVIPTMENAIFARGLQAFQEELHANGITLLVASSQYQAKIEEEQIQTLVTRGADAVLLIGFDRMPSIYEFLKKRDVPALVAWAFKPEDANISIGFDNRAAMKELAEKVIGLGHQKIAVISAYQNNNDRARERVEGIRGAMLDNGLDPSTLQVFETSYSIDKGSDAFTELSKAEDRPTVVMCGNDVLAVGALRAAHQLGLRVPQDVSITGFDDIELASVANPALTTVHVPHRKMGREAARMLLKMASGDQGVERRKLTTFICMRETLSKPFSI